MGRGKLGLHGGPWNDVSAFTTPVNSAACFSAPTQLLLEQLPTGNNSETIARMGGRVCDGSSDNPPNLDMVHSPTKLTARLLDLKLGDNPFSLFPPVTFSDQEFPPMDTINMHNDTLFTLVSNPRPLLEKDFSVILSCWRSDGLEPYPLSHIGFILGQRLAMISNLKVLLFLSCNLIISMEPHRGQDLITVVANPERFL